MCFDKILWNQKINGSLKVIDVLNILYNAFSLGINFSIDFHLNLLNSNMRSSLLLKQRYFSKNTQGEIQSLVILMCAHSSY